LSSTADDNPAPVVVAVAGQGDLLIRLIVSAVGLEIEENHSQTISTQTSSWTSPACDGRESTALAVAVAVVKHLDLEVLANTGPSEAPQ
jgi:hypothetical protein